MLMLMLILGNLPVLCDQALDFRNLVAGEHTGMVFVDSEFIGDGLRRLLAIPGQHDYLLDAERMEPLNRLLRCRLRRIGHGDPADALAV